MTKLVKIFGMSPDMFPLTDAARKELSRALRWIQWLMVSLIAIATAGPQLIG